MIKILFVCHGNICRSPMAEFYMKDLCARAGLAERFEIASAATSAEELGNGVYPPVRRLLNERGIDCSGKTVRLLKPSDYEAFDLILGMDAYNLRNMRRLLGEDEAGKLRLLLDYAGRPGESVADPWYTRDFEAAWEDVTEGCRGLLAALTGARVSTSPAAGRGRSSGRRCARPWSRRTGSAPTSTRCGTCSRAKSRRTRTGSSPCRARAARPMTTRRASAPYSKRRNG